MKGELYQQAISELRRVLAEEPSRVDLQVLLAEALWRDDQRIEAEEVCLDGLEILPNCIVLNAILAEIWLQTGRIPEAQKYLHRLHALTQETRKTVDNETIPGRAFVSEGAFSLPEEASLDFLQTGTIVPSEQPVAPADDWVGEVSFDAPPLDQDALDAIVLEPESGMHSYDWLADIDNLAEGDDDTAVADQHDSESDWFSDDSAKEALNLTTSELDAEWLTDLRGDEEIELPDLDFEDTDSLEEPETAVNESDWFAKIEETADDALPTLETDSEDENAESPDWLATLADNAEPIEIDATSLMEKTDSLEELLDSADETEWFADAEETADVDLPALETDAKADAADDESPDWLAALADKDETIEIDATSLMDENLDDWADSEPHMVEEPKTPFWLSEMANQEMGAVELDPDEALDWLTEPDDEPAVTMELEQQEEEVAPTTVLEFEDSAEEIPEDAVLDTDSLGDADDWLAALTEGELDEEIRLDEFDLDETAAGEEITLDASTDELAALSDNDDWLQTAAADLDSLLEEDEEEFPNLAIPELEPSEITDIPDWLTNDPPTLSEESEATVSSENDPQEVPQPEEPEVESAQTPQGDEADAVLDWLDDLASDADGDKVALPEPPIETEGMPSWLAEANDEDSVEVVDEWDSASAEIPDWLQEPVELADLDEDDLLTEDAQSDAPGLTSLLSEMDVADEADEAVSLDEMDAMFSDWDDKDEEDAGSLTELLGGIEMEGEEGLMSDDLVWEEDAPEPDTTGSDQPDVTDEPEEVGLTGLLSNLTLEEDDTAVPDDDFLADILYETADDDFADLFTEDTPLETTKSDEAIDLGDLGDLDEELSLTELLADVPDEEEPTVPELTSDAADDGWLADLTELAEEDTQPEAQLEEEEIGLTGLLANLEIGEEADVLDTAVSDVDEALPELDDQPAEEMGLTELLAGIDYEEDAVASEINFDDIDYQPVEPSLTEVLSEMEVEPEPEPEVEDMPISAEDTTWLNQLEVDTGDLQNRVDDFDMAEETGLDWLTEPEEPTAVAEEVEPEAPEEEEPVVIEEPDSAPEDWDDAMSWLEELAAQQDDPVGELPSVAENVLDEEIETDELAVMAQMDSPGTDWLADLTGAEEELELDDIAAEAGTQPELAEIEASAEEEPHLEPVDEEMSWLDELATDRLDAALVDEADTAVEPEDLLDVAESDMDVDETAVAVDVDPIAPDEEALIVTGVTDALKEDSGIEEAEADLEEALAWLDDLDEEAELDVAVEPPTTPVELTIDIPEEEEAPETVVVTPEPDELTLALDRLEMRVHEEGITVPKTAVLPLTLSNEELTAALDWIEQSEAEPDLTAVEDIVEELEETAVVEAEDNLDLAEMSDDDPEAWLEQLLSDDLQMDVEMEPPPIKPSEDAVFVTDDAPTQDAEETAAETLLDDLDLDDLEIDAVPDDPDAAVAWLEDQVDEGEAVADDEMALDDLADPEAWLEEMLSGDMALDVDMEPPPIKPSEDAVYVTDDADVAETDTAVTPDVDLEPEDVAVDIADDGDEASSEAADEAAELIMGDLDEDPEAWLEGMLSGDLALDVDMEPPPIKPSEDAVYVTDNGRDDAIAEAESEPEAVPELAVEDETDIIADVPDDPDEAMAWLEQLAAEQGAAIEELPTIAEPEAEMDLPSETVDEGEVDEIVADVAETAVESTEETAVDEDVDAELPDWLGGDDTDSGVVGETDWLRSLPEVDMETWLSAEEEATVAGPAEEMMIPDTGPLSSPSQSEPTADLDDELFEPVIEPSTGAYSVDEARLTTAKDALADGRLDEAIMQFKGLVAEGSGMMAIIAELEQAADTHPQAPALFQVLGDAYMRNGQLQKALTSYRAALDQM